MEKGQSFDNHIKPPHKHYASELPANEKKRAATQCNVETYET